MHSALLHTHNILRWVVLVLGVLAIARAVAGLNGGLPYDRARRAAAMFMGSIHLELLLGLLLLMNSPLVKAAMRDMEFTMQDSGLRKVVVEHPFLMVVAAILVTIGALVSKNQKTDAGKHKFSAVLMTLTLVVILAGIPWQRALFPGM